MNFVPEPANWLLGNSVSEEITNRAYPMRLFREMRVADWISDLAWTLVSVLGFAFVLHQRWERTLARDPPPG
jgi:hypothetical protein